MFDVREGFTAEDIAAAWGQITDYTGATHPADIAEANKAILAGLKKE